MMSTVGAESAPDTAAASVLGDAWAPTGAAGLFGASRNLRDESMNLLQMLTAEAGHATFALR